MALLVLVQALMYSPNTNAVYSPCCMLNQVVHIGDSLCAISRCLQVVNHCMNVIITLRLLQLKKGFVNDGLGFEGCQINLSDVPSVIPSDCCQVGGLTQWPLCQ